MSPRTTKNSSGATAAASTKPAFFVLPADHVIESIDMTAANKRSISIVIRGPPKPKGYHRFNRKSKHTYAKDGKLKRAFKGALQKVLAGRTLPIFEDGPLKVVTTSYLPRPKSHYRGGIIGNELRPSALPIWRARADVDNLAKFVLDGMNQIVFSDDRLITSLTAEKEYDEEHKGGKTCITIVSK